VTSELSMMVQIGDAAGKSSEGSGCWAIDRRRV